MITLDFALLVHKPLIEQFGGSHGIRADSAQISALQRPYATFNRNELYALPVEKVVAILNRLKVKSYRIKQKGECLIHKPIITMLKAMIVQIIKNGAHLCLYVCLIILNKRGATQIKQTQIALTSNLLMLLHKTKISEYVLYKLSHQEL